ncbi:MAG: long-chain fatty acid--CoA ligase [Alphaproteobacteria bacterium]
MDYGDRYVEAKGGWKSLPAAFLDKAAQLGDKPLFRARRYGAWQAISWNQARDQVGALSRGLRALGVAPGDRVVLVSENRPEWGIADLAIMAAGALTVPAYTTNTVDDHVHILEDSGAEVAIVSSARLAERLLPAAQQVKAVRAIVALEAPHGQVGNLTVHGWDEVVARGREMPDDLGEAVARIARNDTACLIYTSGTGGRPKGVMLSHGAILCNCWGAYYLFDESGLLTLDRETFLSFLPLSHSYEHTAGLYFPITIGAEIWYAESIDRLVANMEEARPTIMTAVPRLYEMMHQRILAGVERKGGLSATLFHRAVALGRKRYEQGAAALTLIERVEDWLLDRLVRRKVAQRFGGRLNAFVSGGAPLNYDIGVFFLALGVRLLQGYGQTETAPVVSANPPMRIRIDTVGPAFRGVEVKIAEDGEILIAGELTMQGYWRQPEQSAEALRDGWVHTGDIGVVDPDGYIRITDRKKDIIVLSGGDTLSPQRVEGALAFEPEVSQAMVVGDRKPHLVAVIVPDQDFVAQWSAANGRSGGLAAIADLHDFHEAIRLAVERANARLQATEQVRRFIIASEPFTIDNAMMTPSLKIRRHKIREIYGARLEALYGPRTRAA